MTYKNIVKSMVESDAKRWMDSVLKDNGIEGFTIADEVVLTKDNEAPWIYWTVKATLILKDYLHNPSVEIGCTVDDMIGVCCSVVWDASKNKILWMASEDSRESLNITEFKVA